MSIELIDFRPTDRALSGTARAAQPCLRRNANDDVVYGEHTDSCLMAAEITERELARR